MQVSPEPLTGKIMNISNQTFGRHNSLEDLIEDAKVLHKKLFALSLDVDLDKVGLDDDERTSKAPKLGSKGTGKSKSMTGLSRHTVTRKNCEVQSAIYGSILQY